MGVMTVDGSKAHIEHDADTDSFRGETLGPNKAATDRSRSPVTARARALQMVLCGVVSAVSLTACERVGSYTWQGILANQTPGAISVTYSTRVFVESGGRRYCRIPDNFFIGPAPSRSGTYPSDGPLPLPYMRGLNVDNITCTASFQLGPSQAAYNVFINELCADHATDTRGGDYPKTPFFESLSITAGGRTHVWRGWAAVELFGRSSVGNCVFTFRDTATSR
jgi:hypothetical protein